MSRKIIAVILAAILTVGAMCCFASCAERELKIVYLGDSIAEGVLGASPLSERDNYAYYALIGKNNGYTYINRSVSGHKTDAMLNYISREDDGAMMTKSHIQTADIIQVSILGNDMLQSGLTELLVQYATDDMSYINEILEFSRKNFADIIAKLKELNPDAKLFVQTIYNPVYVGTKMIGKYARESLPGLGYEDVPYGENSYRTVGGKLLALLNGVVYDYHEAHPDDFYIVDVYKAFDEIYNEDSERGAKLIYPDGIHPSNEGHAVIADTTQKLLESLNLANRSKALRNYKDLKTEQLKRLFPELKDMKGALKSIKDASTVDEVTNAYFRAIDGETPALL